MPTLSPRLFIGLIGVALVVTGLVLLSNEVSVDYDGGIIGHSDTACGTALEPVSNYYGKLAVDCATAITTRQTWSWVILAIGAVVTLGAAAVRSAKPAAQP